MFKLIILSHTMVHSFKMERTIRSDTPPFVVTNERRELLWLMNLQMTCHVSDLRTELLDKIMRRLHTSLQRSSTEISNLVTLFMVIGIAIVLEDTQHYTLVRDNEIVDYSGNVDKSTRMINTAFFFVCALYHTKRGPPGLPKVKLHPPPTPRATQTREQDCLKRIAELAHKNRASYEFELLLDPTDERSQKLTWKSACVLDLARGSKQTLDPDLFRKFRQAC